MYRKNRIPRTLLSTNNQVEGETIEQKVRRIVNNKEPIKDGAPLIYTDRKDGVQPDYDIRTDRFDVAIDAMDKVTKSKQAKREERNKLDQDTKEKLNLNEKKGDGGAEPIRATDDKS